MALNGYLPLSSLTRVDGWAYLETNTANAWVAVGNELVALGYPRPSITAPDGAYRDYARQVYWKTYWAARGLSGNASTPGYSTHGFGLSVDVWDVSKWPRAVLTRVMNRHGFVNDVASESWHWHRTSINPADRAAALAGYSGTPIAPDAPPLPKEEDMKLITQKTGGQPALYGEFTFNLIDAATMGGMEPIFGPHVEVSDYVWTYLKDRVAENRALLTSAPASVSAPGSVDLTPVLNAIKAIPAAPMTFIAK